MEEIKVGEYVRTIDGYIRKVEQVNRKGSYDGLCHGAYNVDIPYKYSQGISAKKIKSHSPNIIDLIEEGDYVNGIEVINIYEKGQECFLGHCNKKTIELKNDIYETIPEEYLITNEQIKEVVTKEQFNQVKYEV